MNIVAPVELVLVSFPKNKFTGEIRKAIAKLVNDRIIRIIDILFIAKGKSGDVAVAELSEVEDDAAYKELGPLISVTAGYLNEKDAQEFSKDMKNDSSALLMLFEDTWAQDLASAISSVGGEVVANERIPKEAIEELAEED